MALEAPGDLKLQQGHLHAADRKPRLAHEIVDGDGRGSEEDCEIGVARRLVASVVRHDGTHRRADDVGEVETEEVHRRHAAWFVAAANAYSGTSYPEGPCLLVEAAGSEELVNGDLEVVQAIAEEDGPWPRLKAAFARLGDSWAGAREDAGRLVNGVLGRIQREAEA